MYRIDNNNGVAGGNSLSFINNRSTGLGTEYDSISSTEVSGWFQNYSNSWFLWEALYQQSWACRRVVDYFPEMMALGWGEVLLENDIPNEEEVRKKLDSLKTVYCLGQKMGNLYGDGYVIRLVDDGRELSEPIDYENIRAIEYSRVYDDREMDPEIMAFQADYYNPEYYRFVSYLTTEFQYGDYIQPGTDIVSGDRSSYLVHSDRVLRFKGKFLPPNSFEYNRYRYASVLQDFITPLIRLESSLGHVSDAMASFEVIMFAIEDLQETIANGTADDKSNLAARFKLIEQQLSSMRGAAHDKEAEDIQIVERKFTNINTILAELRNEMIASSGLTKVQLYNEHPSGMNATGESQRRVDAQQIMNKQESKWQELIDFDLHLCMSMYGIGDGYRWEWTSTYQESDQEKLDKRKTIAETDAIYIQNGVLAPEEVRMRFTSTEYNPELVIEEKKPETLEGKELSNEEKLPNEKEMDEEEERTDAVEKFEVTGRTLPISEYEPIDIGKWATYFKEKMVEKIEEELKEE